MDNEAVKINKDNAALLYHNDIISIIQPLIELLGINYFSFRRIYNDGRHIVLTTSPDWILRYYDKLYFKKEEIMKSGINNCFNIIIWDYISNKNSFSKIALNDVQERHNFCHSLSLKYLSDKYMDLYSFAAPQINNSVNEKYLACYESIKKFTSYFLHKAASLIIKAQKTPIYTKGLHLTINEQDFIKKLYDFERQIKLNRLNININESLIKCTFMETQCLNYLKMGLSYKNIAIKLGLSPRTIETHINNLKNKFGVNYKSEIIDILLKNVVNL